MMNLLNKPMLMWQLDSLKKLHIPIVVATTLNHADDRIEDLALSMGARCIRGPEENVYERFRLVTEVYPAANHIRVTGDCPLISPKITEELIKIHINHQVDYSSNFLVRSFPDGLDVEIFSGKAFKKLGAIDLTSYQKEHVTPGFYQNIETFSTMNLLEERNLGDWRWTIDVPSDFRWLESMLTFMRVSEMPEYEETYSFIKNNPKFLRVQEDVKDVLEI